MSSQEHREVALSFQEEEFRPPIPDTSHLITETDGPVDNLFCEKQMRLLTEPLYASWNPGRPFWVAANMGMYEALNATAVVPDVSLSLDTTSEHVKEFGSKCYFFWDHGKPPEVIIEIVSNREGGELDTKLPRYAKLHVDHYAIFDPGQRLSEELLQTYLLVGGCYEKRPQAHAYDIVAGLRLRLWEGTYEGQRELWLRRHDTRDVPIATGAEGASIEAQRDDREAERADRLAARLRELGSDPDASAL